MKKIYPEKLKSGDKICVIAPSRSLAIISKECRQIANKRLTQMGLKVVFSQHAEEVNKLSSSSIKSRVKDLHAAFADTQIKAILTVIGGFNSNQLLQYIDWGLIKKNPKIFCGFSDITTLNNAIFAKTGLVTYSGPHYSTFGQRLYFDYTLEYFRKCLFSSAPFDILPDENWSDDVWYKDQNDRNLMANKGWLIISEGKAEGTVLGANLGTFNLLQGTDFMPQFEGTILFLEECAPAQAWDFDRELQSLIHRSDFGQVKGLVFGRFQKTSKITDKQLIDIVKTKKELNNLPVIANVDFGHTDPKITFPIGGTAKIIAHSNNSKIEILEHGSN